MKSCYNVKKISRIVTICLTTTLKSTEQNIEELVSDEDVPLDHSFLKPPDPELPLKADSDDERLSKLWEKLFHQKPTNSTKRLIMEKMGTLLPQTWGRT